MLGVAVDFIEQALKRGVVGLTEPVIAVHATEESAGEPSLEAWQVFGDPSHQQGLAHAFANRVCNQIPG